MVQEDIWSVTRLNQTAQQLLERELPRLWLEGELSNFKRYASGHWYFSLKDERSQVRGVMFRGNNRQVDFVPQDGQQLRVQADVSLYTANGSFQLLVRRMQPAGQGDLLLKLEQLKQRLKSEGLFAAERKQPLPSLPTRLGVITSASGAAFHDILRVLKRRYPQLPVILYPASVQGARAADELNAALNSAIARNECDVLIIGRGGGSLEDLFVFNDERLTRAVADCPIPIVSAVGHEVDVSLTDFAADARAATPSAAAELIAPHMGDFQQRVSQWQQRLQQSMQRQLRQQTDRLQQLQQRLPTPTRLLQQQAQRLDEACLRLERSIDNQLQRRQERLHHLQQRLAAQRPAKQLQLSQQRFDALQQRLRHALQQQQSHLKQRSDTLTQLRHRLEMAAPENLLKRGYSLTFVEDAEGRQRLLKADEPLNAGSRLTTQLAGERRIHSEVLKEE